MRREKAVCVPAPTSQSEALPAWSLICHGGKRYAAIFKTTYWQGLCNSEALGNRPVHGLPGLFFSLTSATHVSGIKKGKKYMQTFPHFM